MRRLTVVAEEERVESLVKLKKQCGEYQEENIMKIKEEFRDVLSESPGRTDTSEIVIDVGEAKPVTQAPYRVPEMLKNGVKEEIDKLLRADIIEVSTSAWASPIVPIVKPDKTVRVCVDYRNVNALTKQDGYYMPTLDEILEKVSDCCVLTKLDLAKEFYQVKVAEKSKEVTAFISPFGKYQFTRMPFGLHNAPTVFQRLMDVVLRPCYQFSADYIDDILVFSHSWKEHMVHLRKVLEELRRHGLTAKGFKCEWGMAYVEYLGHVGSGVVAVPESRMTSMAKFSQPQSKRDMRAFLGTMSYYRKFIPQFSNYSSVLTSAICKTAPGKVVWNAEMLEAFHQLRSVLCSVCVLHVPCVSDEFVVETDASAGGVGGVLNVVRNEETLPVAYYSRQLRGAKTRYSATELEGLAIYCTILHFAHFLYGRQFLVYTDHKALVAMRTSKVLNRRLQGWALKLQDFAFEVLYREGRKNANADGLSRQAKCVPEMEDGVQSAGTAAT